MGLYAKELSPGIIEIRYNIANQVIVTYHLATVYHRYDLMVCVGQLKYAEAVKDGIRCTTLHCLCGCKNTLYYTTIQQQVI